MPSVDPFVVILQEWIQVFHGRASRGLVRFSKERGLSMSQLGALFHIQHTGSSGVTDLGENLGVSSAAASQLLERLVQQGLILRSEDPMDRRVKQLVLTEKGSQTLQESYLARQGWLYELEHTLSSAEKDQVAAALKILIDKSKQLVDQTDMES